RLADRAAARGDRAGLLRRLHLPRGGRAARDSARHHEDADARRPDQAARLPGGDVMTPRRADLHALAGPYALNALPPGERARFERHLAACDACAQEVCGLQETTARLAAAVAVPPAARLRERVLAQAARTRQLRPVAAGPGPGTRWPWRARRAAAARRLRATLPPWARP